MEIIIALIILLIMLAVGSYYSNKRRDSIDKIKSNDRKNFIKSYDLVDYLGGHPLIDVSKVKEGTLFIFSEKITFADTQNDKELFFIRIDDINNCSVETKESLTATRILLTGIFAWALKKNKSYVRVDFKNQLSNSNNVIFYPKTNNNDSASSIVKTINETRINYLNRVGS